MTVSTDAVLFYGFVLLDGDGDEVGDLEYFLTGEVSTRCTSYWVDIVKERTGRQASEWDIEFDCHCSDECPIWYICVDSVTISASRGEAVVVHQSDLLCYIDDPKDAKLKAFCQAMNIEYKEPAWLLVSYWG